MFQECALREALEAAQEKVRAQSEKVLRQEVIEEALRVCRASQAELQHDARGHQFSLWVLRVYHGWRAVVFVTL